MSILLQPQLFPFDEFADLDDDNSRLALVLWTLPDARLMRWLDEQRAGRRDLYPQVMLWRCVIAKFVYQIGTFAELIRELKRNGSLRRMVGISSVERVPEAWHFSRFVGRLSEPEGQWHLEEMFDALVARSGWSFHSWVATWRWMDRDTGVRRISVERRIWTRGGAGESIDGDGRVVETKRWLAMRCSWWWTAS